MFHSSTLKHTQGQVKDAGRPPAEAGAAPDMRAGGLRLHGLGPRGDRAAGGTLRAARWFECRQSCLQVRGPLGVAAGTAQAGEGGQGREEPGRALTRLHAVRATRCCVLCVRTCGRRAEYVRSRCTAESFAAVHARHIARTRAWADVRAASARGSRQTECIEGQLAQALPHVPASAQLVRLTV